MITDVASCNENTEDMFEKLIEMKAMYCINMPIYNSNSYIEVKVVRTKTNKVGRIKKVFIPHVVRKKGGPLSLRNA